VKTFVNIFKAAVLSLSLATNAFATDKVDINTADAAVLETGLIGIGPAKAAAIVEHRTANGPFKSVEELARVKGIGLRTVEENRERIELRAAASGGKPAAAPAKLTPATPAPAARR